MAALGFGRMSCTMREKPHEYLTNTQKTPTSHHLAFQRPSGTWPLLDGRDSVSVVRDSVEYLVKDSPNIDELEQSLQELKLKVNSLASSLNFGRDSESTGETDASLSSSSYASRTGDYSSTAAGKRGLSALQTARDADWYNNPGHLEASSGNYSSLEKLPISTFSPSLFNGLGSIRTEIKSTNHSLSKVSPMDFTYKETFPVKLGAPHVIGVKSLLPPRIPVRSCSPGKTKSLLIRGRSQSLDRSAGSRSQSLSPASKRTRFLRSRSQSPKPVWRPNSAKTNACAQPPPPVNRPKSGARMTASSRPSRLRFYKPGVYAARSYPSPKSTTKEALRYSWSPYSLPSSSLSSPSAEEVNERFLQSLTEKNMRRSLVEMSPYQEELTQLRLQRLRVEEELLLELKRQQELERTRGPKAKWYEMKGPQFHYEAHKNAELLKSSQEWQSIYNYRQELQEASDSFHQNFQ
ncbi:uncharacterized protein LOC122789321 isoform X2 [Protopterus annectens]|uniref:uncharacterized protein LOC122789321 isoform X2 n=1 Tax=Protopterus annectens TaxID=7888 RepID=UPI001CFBCFC0|nr:uncharacterized protein LOC122789321 isoform X2 [Protopterus annectens]